MRIQFEIKESLINILDQLMHSDFWATEIKEDESGKKIIKIKDLAYNLEAVAEVMGNEIFIRTALSKYTYRIYEVKGECWCEYVGAYRGFLEQKLLPIITPKENLLECEVLDSSILGGKQKTLREYAEDNLKLKKFREQNFGNNGFSKADHPRHPEIINLLPYHDIGKGKHAKLGSIYNPKGYKMQTPSEEVQQQCIQILTDYGLKATIGG